MIKENYTPTVTGRTALFQERQFTGLCQDLMKTEPLKGKRVLEDLPISAKPIVNP